MSQSYPPSGSPPPFDPHNPGDYPPPRRSSGLAWKILLGLLGGGFLLLVVCAGVMFFAFRNMMSMDPAKVRAAAQEIATIQIPEYFQPTMSMSIAGTRMAFFDGQDHRGFFALVDSQHAAGQDRKTFEAEMRRQLNEQFSRQGRFESGEELERTPTTFQVKGAPLEMEVVKSETSDGTIFHEISGAFDGSKNMAFIYVKVPEDKVNLDELRQMIESIE